MARVQTREKGHLGKSKLIYKFQILYSIEFALYCRCITGEIVFRVESISKDFLG